MMRIFMVGILAAYPLWPADPLAKRVFHTDPARYSSSRATHGGAGELRYQTLVGRGVLTDLNFIHRGQLMPRSSIGHHFHNTSEEMFFIFTGEAQFTVDGRTSAIPGPVGVPSRAGHSHALYNPTDAPMEWMNINLQAPGAPAGPGVRDPTATFDLGDDRSAAALDPKPVFMHFRIDRSLLRPVSALQGGRGTAQYRRLMGPSVYASRWAYLDHLLLPEGATEGMHEHPGVDEIYYVMEGEGVARSGSESVTLRKGDALVMRMGEPHSIESAGGPLELLVIGLAPDKRAMETRNLNQ